MSTGTETTRMRDQQTSDLWEAAAGAVTLLERHLQRPGERTLARRDEELCALRAIRGRLGLLRNHLVVREDAEAALQRRADELEDLEATRTGHVSEVRGAALEIKGKMQQAKELLKERDARIAELEAELAEALAHGGRRKKPPAPRPPCAIEWCAQLAPLGQELCPAHARRKRLYGDPLLLGLRSGRHLVRETAAGQFVATEERAPRTPRTGRCAARAEKVVCEVPWCNNTAKTRGLCDCHNYRKVRNGDPYLLKKWAPGVGQIRLVRETARGVYEEVAHGQPE